VIVAKQHRGRSEKRNGPIPFSLPDRTSCGFIAKLLPRPVVFVLTILCREATQQYVVEARYIMTAAPPARGQAGRPGIANPPDTAPALAAEP
jgi:hypothetical protein